MLKAKPRDKKTKSLIVSRKHLAAKREPMTKFKFVMLILQGTTAILVFTLIATVYAFIIFLGHFNKINIAGVYSQANLNSMQIAYLNDKNFYYTNEAIKLNIVNNANESIYLAPCQYFNKFEKKLSDKWEAISLASCDNVNFSADQASIEKISKKVEQFILAKNLGEGVWRGASTVYFGCEKAQAESCKKSQVVHTDEFVIAETDVAVFYKSKP